MLLKKNSKYYNFTVNSEGFRGDEFKKNGDKKIITYGGMLTLGDNEIYPNLLKKKIKNYDVYHFGIDGKGLNHFKDIFFNEIYKYKPIIICLMINRNAAMYDSYSGSCGHIIKEYSKFNLIHYFLKKNLMIYKITNKIIIQLKKYFFSLNSIKNPWNMNQFQDENFYRYGYINSLYEIINYCKNKNISIILIKETININLKISKILKNKSINKLISYLKNNYLVKKCNLTPKENWLLITNALLNKNLELIKSKNVQLIDIEKLLTKKKKNFTNYLHLSSYGHKILANSIAKKVMKSLIYFK